MCFAMLNGPNSGWQLLKYKQINGRHIFLQKIYVYDPVQNENHSNIWYLIYFIFMVLTPYLNIKRHRKSLKKSINQQLIYKAYYSFMRLYSR